MTGYLSVAGRTRDERTGVCDMITALIWAVWVATLLCIFWPETPRQNTRRRRGRSRLERLELK